MTSFRTLVTMVTRLPWLQHVLQHRVHVVHVLRTCTRASHVLIQNLNRIGPAVVEIFDFELLFVSWLPWLCGYHGYSTCYSGVHVLRTCTRASHVLIHNLNRIGPAVVEIFDFERLPWLPGYHGYTM